MGKAKLEFVAWLTIDDGTVIERKVTAGDSIISPSEADTSDLDRLIRLTHLNSLH